MRNIVLLTAAGHGERLGLSIPKQWQKVDGVSITEHTLRKFLAVESIDRILVLYNKENLLDAQSLLRLNSKVSILEGGRSAQETRDIGLRAVAAADDDNIIIHDAVRPMVSTQLIREVLSRAQDADAVVPILKNRDTLFDVRNFRQIYSYDTVRTQTLQLFKYGSIMKAFGQAREENIFDTFYSPFELLNHYGYKMDLIDGDLLNFKITYPQDIEYFRRLKDVNSK